MEFFTDNIYGLLGFVSGLLCVWLLIRENILTFPIGLFYAVLTVYVMYQSRLYADTLLNGYYVIMNAYGWYFWRYGGQSRRDAAGLKVSVLPRHTTIICTLLAVLGSLGMGVYFDRFTDAAYAYPDSFTTVVSFIAMWMAARKYLANWILWFVVNVCSVVLYLLKAGEDPNLYYYAALYAVYIVLAVVGWRAWRVHLAPSAS